MQDLSQISEFCFCPHKSHRVVHVVRSFTALHIWKSVQKDVVLHYCAVPVNGCFQEWLQLGLSLPEAKAKGFTFPTAAAAYWWWILILYMCADCSVEDSRRT